MANNEVRVPISIVFKLIESHEAQMRQLITALTQPKVITSSAPMEMDKPWLSEDEEDSEFIVHAEANARDRLKELGFNDEDIVVE